MSGAPILRPATPLEECGAPDIPTQAGPAGLRFDFNDGARVTLPDTGTSWRVRLSDLDTGSILYDGRIQAGMVHTNRRHYLRARIEVWRGDEPDPILSHDHDAHDREVLIQFPAGALGDTIGWFPYAARFQALHGCRLTVSMRQHFIPLFREAYPDITFVTAHEVDPARYYATYKIMVYYNDHKHLFQPFDHQLIGLADIAAHLLGLPLSAEPPHISIDAGGPPIPERYVCIATQATAQAKYWNNAEGWYEVIAFLRRSGYRVICIDQKRSNGDGLVWNHIPLGVEDQTGDRPLTERGRWLHHASAFIGLSSGLSWLAWASCTTVVLISGFTHPLTEFPTPYRVINTHVCNSCWNDVRLPFENTNYLWCPRHAGTPRQFECSRMITAQQVIGTLRRIPGLINLPET